MIMVVVMVVVVIVIVPILLIVPAMLVLVPPPMVLAPALFASFVQFVARTFGFGTARAMMLERLVQSVIRMFDAVPTFLIFVCPRPRHGSETEQRYAYDPKCQPPAHFSGIAHFHVLHANSPWVQLPQITLRISLRHGDTVDSVGEAPAPHSSQKRGFGGPPSLVKNDPTRAGKSGSHHA